MCVWQKEIPNKQKFNIVNIRARREKDEKNAGSRVQKWSPSNQYIKVCKQKLTNFFVVSEEEMCLYVYNFKRKVILFS